MQQLVQGVHFFQNIGFRQRQELFARLKDTQNPEACMITCADSRVVPNLITNTGPGQIFTIRNVGNVVPCHGTSNNGEMAGVEYAVVELGIEDLIVCGHTGCGAMKALIAPSRAGKLPSVVEWLRHSDAVVAILQAHYTHLKGEALVKAAAEENVLVQLEHLRTSPAIAARLSKGRVRLHGWMYKIDTGEVFSYDAAEEQFFKFGSSTLARAAGAGGNGKRSGAIRARKKAKTA